ncbi:hypothetical protein V9T40_011162 [Parthenolecanium corni]|uniref:Immunoglobulin V-set domain-containing protein n=1 Tax=Parthenolecanium corni TaxID=536013 RepID=A0AAN9XXW1_9HEMI
MHQLIRYHKVKLLKYIPKLQSIPQEIFGDDFTFSAETIVRDVLFEMLKVFFLPFSIFSMYSFLISPFIEFVWKAEDNYILPHWYTCSSSTPSPYSLSFLCVHVDNYWTFLAFNVIQLVIIVGLFHFFFLSAALYFITIRSLEIIAQKLVNMVAVMSTKMDYRNGMLVEGESDTSSWLIGRQINEVELQEDFIRLIRCHQYFRSLADEVRPYLNAVSSASFTIFFSTVLLSIFMISNSTEVSWIRQKSLLILTSGLMTFAGDSRYQVDHSDDSNEWGLMLTNVHLNDAGVYECQINIEPKLKRAIHLIVTSGNGDINFYSDNEADASGKNINTYTMTFE